ncbi:hypothetical protein ACIPRI_23145 [Variovorax sp. LARHSF232]
MTTNHIAAVKAELSTVTALADQLRAIQAAVAREADLKRKLTQLEAQQADADRAAAGKAAAVARFQNIRVEGTGKGNPRIDDYTIHYTASHWDSMLGEQVRRPGKQSLTGPTPELYAAVLADPSVLPAAILALDADADAAVRRYCRDKARGYVSA